MGAVVIKKKMTSTDLRMASEDYGDYIKVVVDIETKTMVIGGEWHVDGEKILRENGSHQINLWGGGVDINNHEISYSAMTNIKPGVNNGHVILDVKTRQQFDKIVKEKLGYE